jgi:dTDP-4-amino-4,6-dideoxygalactose transaminase
MTTRLAPHVPFLDLAATNASVAAEVAPLWSEIIESSGFIGGRFVDEFESEFASFCHTGHSVGLANGTDALIIGLRALGVGPGDEVIAPAHTFVATVEAIELAGAVPVLADVDQATGTLDVESAAAAVTPRTRALLPVHLYGHPAGMAGIMNLASRHGLAVLEDAAQAHGASLSGSPAGALGHAAAFSFYPGKNLGAFGDAGALVTNDPEVARRARILRDHGQSAKYHHVVSGHNSRLDALQASALVVKLRHLPEWNARRRDVAAAYRSSLAHLASVELPVEIPGANHVYHLYVIRHDDRETVRRLMEAAGIGVGLHYPVPVHLQPAFAHLGYERGDFPVSEDWADRCLSLPMCPELRPEQIERVCHVLGEVA